MISERKIGSMLLLFVMIGVAGCQTTASGEEQVPAPEQAPATKQATEPQKTSRPAVRTAVFAPAFKTPAGKRPFDYAYSIYKSSPTAPTGVFTYQGIVFVIVNIDTGKVKTRYPKGPAMLKAKKLLESRYPLPDRYSLNSRQIECRNYRKQKIFRYVLACKESDILTCCRATAKDKNEH